MVAPSLNLSHRALASSLLVCPLNEREERKTRKKWKEEPSEGKKSMEKPRKKGKGGKEKNKN
jgi:hypothetical protein